MTLDSSKLPYTEAQRQACVNEIQSKIAYEPEYMLDADAVVDLVLATLDAKEDLADCICAGGSAGRVDFTGSCPVHSSVRTSIVETPYTSLDLPFPLTEEMMKYGPGWRKVMAYYCDVLDSIREAVGPGHTITDGCPPHDPWHMVPRSVIDEMRHMFRATMSYRTEQPKFTRPSVSSAWRIARMRRYR